MKNRYGTLLSLGALLAMPMVAQAHPGHGPYDFIGGLIDPFTGVNHLLAAGLWIGLRASGINRLLRGAGTAIAGTGVLLLIGP